MEKIEKKKCLRCDHEWWPKSPQEPKICPGCKSIYWDRERVRPKK